MTQFKLEDICRRFPLVGKQICNNLDDESLINFKEAGINNYKFLEQERFFWVRRIGAYHSIMGDHQEVWNRIVFRNTLENIREFALTVHLFCQLMKNYYRNETLSGFGFVRRILRQYHPFYIAFKCDHGPFCGYIVQLTGIQWPTYLDMVRVNDAQILLRYIPNHSSIAVDYQN
jgi:hypothetical protein